MPLFKVKGVFPYRSARVAGRLFSMPRGLLDALEDECASQLGCWKDNHVVYEVELDFETTIFLQFTDFRVIFGTEVEEVKW